MKHYLTALRLIAFALVLCLSPLSSRSDIFDVRTQQELEAALKISAANSEDDTIRLADGALYDSVRLQREIGFKLTLESGYDQTFSARAASAACDPAETELPLSADAPRAPKRNTTGPLPPPGVEKPDAAFSIREFAVGGASATILGVPAYEWRHGCGPTAVGMVAGYYDVTGRKDIFSGSAAVETESIRQAIASQRSSLNPGHYEDYSQPIDEYPDVYADKSEAPAGDEHTHDCIADYMHTSWSSMGHRYGWSYDTDIGPAFKSYVNLKNSVYAPKASMYYMDEGLTWSVLKTEINNNRPMVFNVDTDADGMTDHFVTVIGYRDSPSRQYACLDTWFPADEVRWCDFAFRAQGQAWGIDSGWKFSLDPTAGLSPDSVDIKANASDSQISIARGDALTVTCSLQAGPLSGKMVEWWIGVLTPFPAPLSWFHLSLAFGWVPGLTPTLQGYAGDLTDAKVLQESSLPLGTYLFFFGIDTKVNGLPDMNSVTLDSIRVTITK